MVKEHSLLSLKEAARALSVHEQTIRNVEAFVTWNARHFRNKTKLPVLTPSEFMDQHPHPV